MVDLLSDLKGYLKMKYGDRGRVIANLADNESIVDFLDSFEAMDFLFYVEDRCGVRFNVSDYACKRLDSLKGICECVEEKKGAGIKHP